MSTYAEIQGVVTIDSAAAAHFRTTVSWEWCEPAANGLSIEKREDGSLELSFQGTCYRNWCRYVLEDLFEAQQRGDVHGVVTIECSDGGNWRTVATFESRSCKLGTQECYLEPVLGAAAVMREVEFARGHSMRFLTPGDGATEVLEGADVMGMCGCGGWDDDEEVPLCRRANGAFVGEER